MNYQRKQLPDTNIGDPAPLPPEISNWDDAALADVGAANAEAAQELGFAGQGFFPVADPPPPPPAAPVLSTYDFLNLFTSAERVGILTAAQSNMQVADWLNLLNHVQPPGVHLDDPKTIAGVEALQTAGLIAAGRAAQILANTAP